MTMTLSRWSKKTINLSVQFLMDCDILGDPCLERPQISSYEQFWKRFIPIADKDNPGWDQPTNVLRSPSKQLTQSVCDNYRACYPGKSSCQRTRVLSGECDSGSGEYGVCPVYFLYNWRWIKSHLAEVGAVTSTILVRSPLFTYADGVYSSSTTYYGRHPDPWSITDNSPQSLGSAIDEDSNDRSAILGMLDVTIIGWGQSKVNLTKDVGNNKLLKQRWWYVVPHLGMNYGLTCNQFIGDIDSQGASDLFDSYDTYDRNNPSIDPIIDYTIYNDSANSNLLGIQFLLGQDSNRIYFCKTNKSQNVIGEVADVERTGIIKFNRRFDDSNIESQAVGAVPWNFQPKPWRTPHQIFHRYVGLGENQDYVLVNFSSNVQTFGSDYDVKPPNT